MSVTGLILAGGRATRMDNVDKGLQDWHGQALVSHIAGKLAPQVTNLMINANRYLDTYSKLGYPVYSDIKSGAFNGPLAGVEVGLLHCTTPYLLTVPCDCPFFPDDLAARLMRALQNENADIATVCTGDSLAPQPVFCLLKKSLLDQVQRYLENGGRKMDGWYGQARVARVYFDNAAEFNNMNTAEELRAGLAISSTKKPTPN